jgi:hypothetical protein
MTDFQGSAGQGEQVRGGEVRGDAYNSKIFLETRSFSHTLVGNGPIVVEKEGGAVHILASATPVEEQLENLRHGKDGGPVP